MKKEYTEVEREIMIRATPERVWKALTDPEERNLWETRSCKIELKIGGTVELDYGWGVSYKGTINELIPSSRLSIMDEHGDLTIWSLEPQQGGTLVSIKYTGLWSGDLGIMNMENMAYGTYRFMTNLKSMLEEALDKRQTFWKSWIGVNHITAVHPEIGGVRVVQVIPDTPASGYLQVNDIITQINGESVNSYDQCEELITSADPQHQLDITYVRDGHTQTIEVITIAFGQKLSASTSS
ncbi:SRPBCC domain-containing protein [Paenibacillus sp. J22TS3]|uniref:SRPBCC domain-containing protein n=1 Tax=Paenibacillus sp. J22TS3 TaxID=2807192 RepID=UPI001B0CF844|nr:SRPBCC domain-containing protein [Paenibacillus sp. J22TS3]GIP23968.1 hypothetical protein J22TS3_42430 [Paenibacillus sp. J22TS3]